MIKQGQTIYLSGGYSDLKGEPREVIKVGKKYFYVKNFGKDLIFELGSNRYTGDSNYPYIVWEHLEDYLHNQEKADLVSKLRPKLDYYGLRKLSLSELQAIDKIITKQ